MLLVGLFACLTVQAAQTDRMDLSGLWRFQLDPMGFGKTPGSELYLSKLTETIELPGSMDEGGKGIRNIVVHVDRLSRKFEYCGQAWYQREVVIPEEWEGREIILSLERCHWETAVFVDGEPPEIPDGPVESRDDRIHANQLERCCRPDGAHRQTVLLYREDGYLS